MTPEDIMAKFADTIKKFKPIDSQLSDTNLTQVWEVLVPLLLQIPYDKTGGTQNLIGLIQSVAEYTTRPGAKFAEPTFVGAYNATIDDNATAIVCARI